MTRLAQRSDGNTYFRRIERGFAHIFAAELGDVLNVVARRLVVASSFPIMCGRLLCRARGVIRGRKAELTLNQLYGGQEKFALVESR